MNTSYNEIYDRFVNKIEDYEFLQALYDDEDWFDSKLLKHLTSAISSYTYTTEGFDRDDESLMFKRVLDEPEKEALSYFMVVDYLTSKIVRDELTEQALGSRDFRQWSPANLLRAVKETQSDYRDEAISLMNVHYFSEGDV